MNSTNMISAQASRTHTATRAVIASCCVIFSVVCSRYAGYLARGRPGDSRLRRSLSHRELRISLYCHPGDRWFSLRCMFRSADRCHRALDMCLNDRGETSYRTSLCFCAFCWRCHPDPEVDSSGFEVKCDWRCETRKQDDRKSLQISEISFPWPQLLSSRSGMKALIISSTEQILSIVVILLSSLGSIVWYYKEPIQNLFG